MTETQPVLVTLITGHTVRAVCTTEHAASSYGQAVLVAADGELIDPVMVLSVRAEPVHLKAAPGQTVWDCLAEAGVHYTRIGAWHEQPRPGEVLVATVRVHPHDPDVPVFLEQ